MAQYLSFFNLKNIPFRNAPDMRLFVALDHTIRVESAILSSLSGGHGLAVLIGDVGSGKTTLTHHLIESLPRDTHVFWLAYPPETPDELYNYLLRDLGVTSPPTGRTLLLDEIRSILMREALQRSYVLVVDEAHYSNDSVLDALKFLNNLEGHGGKLIQILLVGQQELTPLLRKPQHASLAQRVSCMRRMSRLTPSQSLQYIKSRLERAGGALRIFTPTALKLLVKMGEGVPRRINNLCHETMLRASLRSSRVIEEEDVVRAGRGLRVGVNPLFEDPGKAQIRSSSTEARIEALPSPPAKNFNILKYTLAFFFGGMIVTMSDLLDVNVFSLLKKIYPVVTTTFDVSDQSFRHSNSLRLGIEHVYVDGSRAVENAPPDLELEIPKTTPLTDPEMVETQPDFEGKISAHAQSDFFWSVAGSHENLLFKPFAVQLGTFATEEQSLKAFWFWQAKGYPVYQHSVQRDAATTRYVVRLGGFETMEEATEAAKLFNRLESEQAISVSVVDRSPVNGTVTIALPGPAEGEKQADMEVNPEKSSILPDSTESSHPDESIEIYHFLAKGRVQTHAMTAATEALDDNEGRALQRGFIEVAVLEERSVAESLADQFEGAGLAASVFTVWTDGKLRHRVLVGPFASPEEAVRVQADARSALEAIN